MHSTLVSPISVASRYLWLVPGLTHVTLASGTLEVPTISEDSTRVLCTAPERLKDWIADLNDARMVHFRPAPADMQRSAVSPLTLLADLQEQPHLPVDLEWPVGLEQPDRPKEWLYRLREPADIRAQILNVLSLLEPLAGHAGELITLRKSQVVPQA